VEVEVLHWGGRRTDRKRQIFGW